MKARYDKNQEFLRRVLRRARCSLCGFCKYRSALEFHHIDPATKKKDVGSACVFSREYLKAEMRKCIVVCGNCHRAIHAGEIMVDVVEEAYHAGL